MTVRKDGWESGGLVIPTGDQWTDALYLASNGVIEPLAGYLEGVAAGRVPALTPEQLGYLAGIVRVLHMRGQKRPRGKPRGTWGRWGDPNYVAAWVAEPRIAIWKHDNGQPNIPETVRTRSSATRSQKSGSGTSPGASRRQSIGSKQSWPDHAVADYLSW